MRTIYARLRLLRVTIWAGCRFKALASDRHTGRIGHRFRRAGRHGELHRHETQEGRRNGLEPI